MHRQPKESTAYLKAADFLNELYGGTEGAKFFVSAPQGPTAASSGPHKLETESRRVIQCHTRDASGASVRTLVVTSAQACPLDPFHQEGLFPAPRRLASRGAGHCGTAPMNSELPIWDRTHGARIISRINLNPVPTSLHSAAKTSALLPGLHGECSCVLIRSLASREWAHVYI